MRRLFPGSKPVIVEIDDDVEFVVREYPLARIVAVSRRRWHPLRRLKACWHRLMDSPLTDQQMQRLAARFDFSVKMLDIALKATAVTGAFYFVIEIGKAFLTTGGAK